MDRKRVDAKDGDQYKNERDIYPNPVPRRQPLIGHDESDRCYSDDDLKIPDLKKALPVLEEQRNRVRVLFH